MKIDGPLLSSLFYGGIIRISTESIVERTVPSTDQFAIFFSRARPIVSDNAWTCSWAHPRKITTRHTIAVIRGNFTDNARREHGRVITLLRTPWIEPFVDSVRCNWCLPCFHSNFLTLPRFFSSLILVMIFTPVYIMLGNKYVM